MVPLQINNSFAEIHYENIKMNLLKQIERILDDGGIQKRPRGQATSVIEFSDQLEDDLELFISDPDNNLKPLITLNVDLLESKIQNLLIQRPNYLNKWHDDNLILKNIFIDNSYDSKSFDKWDFINAINIDTCPYCNRNYIYTTKKNKKIKPQIDHFYPKSKYPILGLSYFNLIPSCPSCNGFGAKEENDPFDVGLINPYLLNAGDFVFTHKIKNIAIINPLVGKSDVKVYFKSALQGHLDIFNLKDLYELHNDHALELIIKKRIKYSKKYREYLNSYSNSGLKFSKSELDRMILGNYSLEKEQHKRPLSKLYQDLGKELGLI
jgi:5-methylcytosine-specific restriction endonuclease McrA